MPYFITTAIDYANGAPHIGHAYEKVLGDVISRYQRLKGEDVYFLTGVDQHGQKVQQTAEKEGIHPATFSKKNTKKFLKLWEKLGLQYDGWAETTDERHKACVQKILTKLEAEGQLYKKAYKGFYSVRQEQFLTDKEKNEQGEFGSEWGEVVEIEEENWYFKLSEHTDWLRQTVENNDLEITPAFRKADVLNALDRTSGTDLCISRPKERLRWGIELPFDPDYVTYVWFDALINYISFAGYEKAEGSDLPDFDYWWPANAHIIGKDILVPPHAIYWPCMLHAMGFSEKQMPTLLVHGWWNIRGEKMSKSIGNVVDPDELADRFGVDALRYYLVRDIPMGKDSDFDVERLIMLFNTELANDLGNLLNRSLNMTKRFLDARLPETSYDDEESQKLRKSFTESVHAYQESMELYDVAKALAALNNHISFCNGYLERQRPWELAKDESQQDRLAAVMYHVVESCAHAAILLSPIVPSASAKIIQQLQAEELTSHLKLSDCQWGILPTGHQTGKPKPVFPRIEIEKNED